MPVVLRSRPRMRASMLSAALLVAGLLIVGNSPASAQVACPAAKPDKANALKAAKACGGPVEVLDHRTSSSRILANADGTAAVETFPAARWAKRGDGSWTDVDTRLHFDSDDVVPGATVLPVRLSGGGDAPLATLTDAGRQVAMAWPGHPLPRPVLSGDTATYAEVLPGVDLKVTALADGFSEVLVVKSAAAAKHPALTELGFKLTTTGVSLHPAGDGGVEALDAGGATVFRSPRALMWDSSGAAAVSEQSQMRGAGVATGATSRKLKPMQQKLSGGDLQITPDAGFLADPATQYPVYVDPMFTGNKASGAWAVIADRSDLKGSTFWKTTFMSDGGTFGDAGAGRTCDNYSGNTCNSTTYLVRSLFRMEMPANPGTVLSANFEILQKWAWTCSPNSNADLLFTDGFGSNVNWNNQPAAYLSNIASSPANNRVGGGSSCGNSATVSLNTTGMVAGIAGAGDISVELRSSNEGSNLAWHRFDSSTAVLHVQYDHVPDAPSLANLRMGSDGQVSCGQTEGTAARIKTSDGLTLNAVLTDADAPAGDHVSAIWEVSSQLAGYTPANSGFQDSGSNFQTTIPGAAFSTLEGQVLKWRVKGTDTVPNPDNTPRSGDFSPWCYFMPDNTALGIPALTSTDIILRDGNSVIPPPPSPTKVGQTGAVTFTPAAGDAGRVTGYRYGVWADSNAELTIWIPARPDGTAVAAVTALPFITSNSVTVAAVKADGTAGSPISRVFRPGAGGGVTTSVTGDATGDGRADVTFPATVGTNQTALFRLNSNMTAADSNSTAVLLAPPIAPQGNARVYNTAETEFAQGDFDGDGLTDVATLYRSGSNAILGIQRSDGNQLTTANGWSLTLTGWSMADLTKVKLVAGDFDGDHKTDVLAGYWLSATSWEMRVFRSNAVPGAPSFEAVSNWRTVPSDLTKATLLAADMDGDGDDDVMELYDFGGNWTTIYSHESSGSGRTLGAGTQQWESFSNGWFASRAKYFIGDINGDGRDDIGALYDNQNKNVELRVFLSGLGSPRYTGWTQWWTSGGANTWDFGLSTPVAGDFNADGHSDVALVHNCCGAFQQRAWTLLANAMFTTGSSAFFNAPVPVWNGAVGPVNAGSLPPDDPNRRYQLVSDISGKCLTIPGNSTSDGAQLQLQPCSATNLAGQFTLHLRDGGQMWVEPAHVTGKCLGTLNGALGNNPPIVQYTCGQEWQKLNVHLMSGGLPGTNPLVSITMLYDGMCVDLNNGGTADGTAVWQWTCNFGTAQKFTLRPVA
ncbi:VCBS repeat-containing protein [Dactylosporangium vinaceum]|uniref:FG-GAP-like repeat-containing protein n=1 Tax=Dactylosporangium vinaceum TaxID=53362 RepID=A0ABV5MJP5_9ACTN|nr:FG-GAP-like repeat-containing protein [Dactylosporangium vinaceum]UAB92666.1 VCBS repeat-containing protein [Dactylosporangium vinaceum]